MSHIKADTGINSTCLIFGGVGDVVHVRGLTSLSLFLLN